MGQGVSLKEIVEKMNLKNLTPDVDLVEKYVQVPDINRPDLQPCIRTGSRAFRKGYTGGYTGSDHTKINILFHGGADSLDECETGTVYFHSRSTCGCVWCRCTDYGREWNR